jgi:hypothetical protein
VPRAQRAILPDRASRFGVLAAVVRSAVVRRLEVAFLLLAAHISRS